ncbi:efflux RND transporter permease subunit [Methylosinus sp. H3A]|uniref:efflux RND transporter permease subunit n=1 Tax=Methylosinus sp. H3A TaxID=2785786 RepID=UPI0018C2123E|nr:efflux RND transporter permease subunit [Methylosinus sp. H3A]MBG0808249.1 efflux RND transporter permease subunit [Methylosinus sp. H3A]
MDFLQKAITRPVATTLLTLGCMLLGLSAFFYLPIAPFPQVDYPTIYVTATMPGAGPETMASSVATPLERHLGRIADVREISSSSISGMSSVFLEFGLARSVDGAARDVQAAINSARVDLPATLRANPTYTKANPGENPIFILALTSSKLSQSAIYDAATVVLQQKLAQVDGVGRVLIVGSSLPGVRIELNPGLTAKYGVALEDVRVAIAATNVSHPKGALESNESRLQIYANDQIFKAADYRDIIVATRNGGPVRLADIADVADSVEDLRTMGLCNGAPAVQVILYRQPGANMVETVDRVRALLPALSHALPGDLQIDVVQDRTLTIRNSLRELELALLIAIVLVVVVVFLFLRDAKVTLISTITIPATLSTTFALMYAFGYSINNLSLMALTIATGVIVDDAIVVVECAMRRIEAGAHPFNAAMESVREAAFTIIAMSLSLVAVFLPVSFLDGVIGRMLREFAIVLTVAIVVSMVLSLTTTPMLCGHVLRMRAQDARPSERLWGCLTKAYSYSLSAMIARPVSTMAALSSVIVLNLYLFAAIPKSLFPFQDTGRVRGTIIADQSASYTVMTRKLEQTIGVLQKDPDVFAATGTIGGNLNGPTSNNRADLLVWLKPRGTRRVSADEVIARLRAPLRQISGATIALRSVQDLAFTVASGTANYTYILKSDDLGALRFWAPRLTEALAASGRLLDVVSDQQDKSLQTRLEIDRVAAARLNLTAADIDNELYDAFGQRHVSTLYAAHNQYHVVMELAPQFVGRPRSLENFFFVPPGSGSGVESRGATPVARAPARAAPLAQLGRLTPVLAPIAVNHWAGSASVGISFSLPPTESVAGAASFIRETLARIGAPPSIHGELFTPTGPFEGIFGSYGFLIFGAIAVVYIILGVLYESYVHPITILSTLPSAGVGAALALLSTKTELSLFAMIGLLMLTGVAMKNAIMMIDVALAAQRSTGLDAARAIELACVERLRPIMMTTAIAFFSALPLALGNGEGAEIRQPLGISIAGGILSSLLLTLYTTPVVYVLIDRLSRSRAGKS